MRWLWRVILFVVVVSLFSGVAQIRPEERGIVRRFGRVVDRPGPGLWFGLPWGIDQLDRVAVKTVRQLELGGNPELSDDPTAARPWLTGDQNLVHLKLILDYAIDERASGLDDYLSATAKRDGILERELEALASEWLSATRVDDALLTGRAALPRFIMARLAERLEPHRLGIVVQRVSVDHLAAPPEVRDAFEAVTQAQTGIRTKENQAEQEAAQRLRDAQTLKYRAEQSAAAYQTETHAAATADAQTFRARLEQYTRLKATNPDALAGIWWDEMGRVLLGMKGRGRVELLDAYLGKDGLDVTQFVPPKKR